MPFRGQRRQGVEIRVRRCRVRPEEVTIQPQPVPVLLERKDGVFKKEK